MLLRRSLFAALAALLFVSSLVAEIRLPAILSDLAVLQADRPIRIWGWTDPGEPVTVTLAGNRATATADHTGRWEVTLSAMEAGFTPYDLLVATPSEQVVRTGLLIGDVWLASGQSNIENRLSITTNGAAYGAAANDQHLRLFRVARALTDEPAEDVTATWTVTSPSTAPAFSAIAYHFGKGLREATGRPVGMIMSAHGATAVEAWLSAEALAGDPGAATVFQRTPTTEPRYRSVAWNGMAAPLVPFTLGGILWYQGETNAHWGTPPEYSQTFPLLIRTWRDAWRDPDLPVVFFQLPNYQHTGNANLDWPKLREQQLAGLTLPKTAMVVTIDIGDSGDIHPLEKTPYASRALSLALRLRNGEDVRGEGPRAGTPQFSGSTVRVPFELDPGTSLVLKPGVTGFELAGSNRTFYAATAVLEGNTVVLQSANVPSPVAVRYAWRNDPKVALFDSRGLPAAPFRSDNWDNTGPLLTKQPESVVVPIGGRVELKAEALGPNLAYQWLRAGTAVSGATSPTLVMDPVTPAQAGEYRLRVSEGGRVVYSVPAVVTVINGNETVLADPATAGHNGWDVRASEGTLVLNNHSGKPVFRLTNQSASSYGTLIFEPVEGTRDLSEHAEIRVTVTNPGALPVSFTAWALSGPGWGGAPATGQLTDGGIPLAAGASTEVVIPLHQRYPGTLQAPMVDPAQISSLRFVLQPGSGASLAVGPIRVAGMPVDFVSVDPERSQVPPAEVADPAPGRRIIRRMPGRADTRLTHTVTLPENWESGGRYPLLVEYPGNVFFNRYCHSTGLTRDANFGPSIAAGSDFIVLQLPIVNTAGNAEERDGWGNPTQTLTYAHEAILDTIEQYGADPSFVLLTGFSRGAYAADYLGLRDPEQANFWHGFVISQGYPASTGGWNGSTTGYAERLARLQGRPVFLLNATWEGATATTSADAGLSSTVHTDIALLEPGPARNALRNWLANVREQRPGTRTLRGKLVDAADAPLAGILVYSGISGVLTGEDGSFEIPGLVGATRTVYLGSGAAFAPAGVSVPASGNYFEAGTLVSPFRITVAPSDQSVPAGQNAVFSVGITPAGGVTYTWRYNGNLIAGANSAVLNLNSVTPEQAGLYTVAITGAGGATVEASAKLSVSAPLDIPVPENAPVLITVADGMIHDRFPDDNHNSAALQISSRGVPWNRKVYISFTLDPAAIPSGRELDAAEIRLQLLATGSVLLGSATGTVPVSLYGMTDPNATWNETTLTWNNAPYNLKESGASFIPSGSTLLATVVLDSTKVTNGQIVRFRSPEVVAFLNTMLAHRESKGGGPLTITVMLHSEGGTGDPGFSFSRRESPAPAKPAELAYVLKPLANLTVSLWRQMWFGTAENAGDAADAADPDGDGLPNVIEHALGLDPTSRDAPILPTEGGLVFPLPVTVLDVDLTVQASFDLSHWWAVAESRAGQAFELLDPGYTMQNDPERPGWIRLMTTLDPLPPLVFHRLVAEPSL